MAVALRDAGHWADIVDRHWRHVYMTDDFRLSCGGLQERVPVAIGAHYFGPEAASTRLRWRQGPNTLENHRHVFAAIGGWALADTPGGRDEMRELVDPSLRDIVDQLLPVDPSPAMSARADGMHFARGTATGLVTAVRVHNATGRLVGTALILKPAARPNTLHLTILMAFSMLIDLRGLA
jgi:hypothetical protein